MSAANTFDINEKLLCYHGPVIYHAKCIKTRKKNGETEYYVHYERWNKQWDEWVSVERLLKLNRENLAHKDDVEAKYFKELESKKGGKRKLSSGTPSKSPKIPKTEPKSSKKKHSLEEKNLPQIIIPEELKKILVDDWDLNKNQANLLSIPSTRPIIKILKDFSGWKLDEDTKRDSRLDLSNVEAMNEFTGGVIDYFNACVERSLLYVPERALLSKYRKENEEVPQFVEIYGVVHLLRLFVKIFEFLRDSAFSNGELGELVACIDSFLSFISNNIGAYFSFEDYYKAAV